jgi:hypothetical protein
MVAAAVATAYAVKNRSKIKLQASKGVEGVKERGALAFHKRIGMPVYTYLKEKNYIPF